MFESLRRAQLTREGFSCGRTRRKHQDDDFWDVLRYHPSITGTIAVGFIVSLLVLMQVASGMTEGLARPSYTKWLCAIILGMATLVHLHLTDKRCSKDNRNAALILGTLLLHLSSMVAALKYAAVQGIGAGLLVSLLPHAIAPIILSVMQGRRAGMFAVIHATVLGAVVLPQINPLTWMTAASLMGSVAVLATRRVRRRNRILIAGLYVGGVAGLLSLALGAAETPLPDVAWGQLAGFPFLSGLLCCLVIGGLLPVLEALFDVTTDITWLEMSDLNHPLMRRLSMEAPGTYHHSLVVANLAEAAAESIGAGATMARVCAYFHDIGKLNRPEYFIENMDPADNPHKDLTSRMSALILVAHVKDGVDLAIKHNLNSSIIDVIEQHHGTSLAWYFYQQALNQKAEVLRLVEEDKATEDDVPQITEDVFRYPGPRPQFKESAIISLADAVESASRTLDKPTAKSIDQMVEELVHSRMLDGQLDESDLTLAELARVKASFGKTLMSMMHSRIKYQQRIVDRGGSPAPRTEGGTSNQEPTTRTKTARRKAGNPGGPSAA